MDLKKYDVVFTTTNGEVHKKEVSAPNLDLAVSDIHTSLKHVGHIVIHSNEHSYLELRSNAIASINVTGISEMVQSLF